MPRYKEIYRFKAREYDALVSREDYEGNLFRALNGICQIEGKELVEFGAGTGRLTRLLAPRAKSIRAFDLHAAMIEEARAKLSSLGILNVEFDVAENKSLPVANYSADITIAGWSFGHAVSWFPETWKEEIASSVREMIRITRPSGAAIVLETLGTGCETPTEPNRNLGEYYAFLEGEFGFTRSWIRTDYRFGSVGEADELTESFFGKKFNYRVLSDGAVLLPECTGIWFRRF